MIISKRKKGSLAIKKAKKSVPAVRKAQPSVSAKAIRDFNTLLDTFRDECGDYLWDPFRGFEWPIE